MVAYLMAVVSSIPNTAARCRGEPYGVRLARRIRLDYTYLWLLV